MKSKFNLNTLAIPKWLERLPPGEYTLMQACQKTTVSKLSVYMRFVTLKLERKRITVNADGKKLTRGYDVYVWPGAEFFIKKQAEERLESIKKA